VHSVSHEFVVSCCCSSSSSRRHCRLFCSSFVKSIFSLPFSFNGSPVVVVPFSPGLPLSFWFTRCYPCRRTHARAQPCSKDFLGFELLWKHSWLFSCFSFHLCAFPSSAYALLPLYIHVSDSLRVFSGFSTSVVLEGFLLKLLWSLARLALSLR
jgi:hypothetical protein